MSRYNTGNRRAWTDDDVSWLLSMADEGVGQAAIARMLNRTISSVEGKLRLLRMDPLIGPGLSRYEKPEAVECDDAGHLRRIEESNRGCAFPIVTEALINRLYAFERSVPKRRAA